MKKQLLSESEIRKMMKYADMGALTDNFITETAYGRDDEQVEEAVEDVAEEVMDDEPMDAPVMDEPMEEPMEEPEELPAEEDAGMTLTDEEATVLVALGTRLGAVLGDEGELEPALGDEEEAALPPSPEMAPEDEELEEELEAANISLEEDKVDEDKVDEDKVEEDVVNEVARRVARRLLKKVRS